MTKKGADLTTFGQHKKGADLTKKGADLTNSRQRYLTVVVAFFSLAKTEFDYLLPILSDRICIVECITSKKRNFKDARYP